MEYERMINRKLELEYQLFVGRFGGVEMILYLTNKMELIFCRLSGELFIRFNNGFSFSRWTSGRIWLLDATGC
jgi:hypothetical protein